MKHVHRRVVLCLFTLHHIIAFISSYTEQEDQAKERTEPKTQQKSQFPLSLLPTNHNLVPLILGVVASSQIKALKDEERANQTASQQQR